ncbi:MAG: right-handed parallel beta-helix repeat-containing protein [Pseudonocardiaceae bacterium]
MAPMRVPRAVSVWSLVLLSVLVLGTGCGSADQQPTAHAPSGCTHTITQADDVSVVLADANPGETFCLTGGDLAGADVTMMRSGTAGTPVRLVGDGTTVRDIHVAADYVSVEGFVVAGGDGMLLQGVGLTARNNTVRDTQQGGITCASCIDSTIASNTVQHVATVGIWIRGQRITVDSNTVSGTVPRGDGDADGVRFFGNGHRITRNTIRDISAEGYASPPHPDCFQTYDDNSPPTFDVVISGNTCRNVDAQCLIATGDQGGNSGVPAGMPSITFVGNTCASNGDQAVNLRRWPGVELRQNTISGPNLTRGIMITDGSTGCTVIANTTRDPVPLVEVDDSSRPGFHEEANSP